MTTFRLVLKELRERKSQLITSFLAIALGITVIVAVRTMSHFSEKAVAQELDNLGANVLILPKGATVSNYYTADFGEYVMPESYVDDVTTSRLKGVDNLSPKLTEAISLSGQRIYLTGILPKNEFKSKPAWQTADGIFARPEGCGTVVPGSLAKVLGGSAQGGSSTSATRQTVVQELGIGGEGGTEASETGASLPPDAMGAGEGLGMAGMSPDGLIDLGPQGEAALMTNGMGSGSETASTDAVVELLETRTTAS